MKNAIFIYNPVSGDHSIPSKLDYIMKRFQENFVLLQPYRLSEETDHMLPEFLKQNNYDFAIISGGDGTLNSIINVMMKNEINIPVGIFPYGTSNDFARCLSLPSNLSEIIDIILAGNTIEVDAGLINEQQYFLSTCAGGGFVDVSFSTHNELKKNFGPLAYYLKAISEVKNIKSFKVKIKTETKTIEEQVLLFFILNGKHAAGFYNLIEEADISDGMMDIVLIKSCSHIDLASLFFNVLSNAYLNNKNVMKLQAKTCEISGDNGISLSVDGEKGDGLPVTIRFINKALKVFVK
ncbi:MAG: YegS/Rv2252/BmrU family lipid kinase [Clostridia bacterium]|nr:YegS/Rv2252/BmrU family lipid kinase [Clostridia bacterium]